MESKNRKEADKKYAQSEKGKAAQTRYEQTKKGKVARRAAKVHYDQIGKGKVANARASACYARTEAGKLTDARAKAKRKRDLGFKPLNNWFPDSHGHHLNQNDVLYIPAELHNSIKHKQDDLDSMRLINEAAFEWFYAKDE